MIDLADDRSIPPTYLGKLIGVVRLAHPFPTVLNAVLAALFSYVASPAVLTWRVLTVALSVAAIHGSIGSLNDYCDYLLDKSGKPSKPLVQGVVTRRFARSQVFVLAFVGILLSLFLGWLTACFAVVVLLAGTWYDVWAKGTVVSWVPFAIFVPSLPVWAFAASGRFEARLLSAYPLGILLSLGLNVANTLPDVEDDAAHGVQGLTHKIGVRRGIFLAWASFAGAILGLAGTLPLVANASKVPSLALIAAVVVLIVMIGDYAICRSHQSLKRTWYASTILSALVGLAWVTGFA